MSTFKRIALTCVCIGFTLVGLGYLGQAAEDKGADGKPQAQMKIISNRGEAFIIPECECLLLAPDSVMSIIAVLDPSKRPEKYRTIDLQKGDLVLMVNGKRMSKPAQFQSYYDSLKLGAELKIAVKRDGKPVLVSFQKGEPITGGKMNIQIGGDDSAPEEGGRHRIVQSFGGGGDFDDVDALAPLGILIGFKNHKASIMNLMPHAAEVYGEEQPSERDEIVSIDGVAVKSLESLETVRATLTARKKGSLVVRRDGKELSFPYTVPTELPNIMIDHK